MFFLWWVSLFWIEGPGGPRYGLARPVFRFSQWTMSLLCFVVRPLYQFTTMPRGTSTVSITWITPLLVSMSAVVTFALLILTAPFRRGRYGQVAPQERVDKAHLRHVLRHQLTRRDVIQ